MKRFFISILSQHIGTKSYELRKCLTLKTFKAIDLVLLPTSVESNKINQSQRRQCSPAPWT